jgi:hypothetical protein
MEEIFIPGTQPQEFCSVHAGKAKGDPIFPDPRDKFVIAFPQNNDVFKLDPVLRRTFQKIKFKTNMPTETGIDRVEWWVDEHMVGEAALPFSVFWNLEPGLHTVEAVAFIGAERWKSASVRIKVEE